MEDTLRLAGGRHVFVSYADAGKLEMISKVCSTFALDNGAYSAWRNGDPFDFNGYEEFVERWRRHPAYDWCVIPDVIGGSEEENDGWLGRWPVGLGGVPVWHMDESLDRLARLTSGYDRIALGSSGVFDRVGSEGWWRRMSEAMEVLCDGEGRPKVKLHGMRMLNRRVLDRLPLSSADSTHAQRAGLLEKRFGQYVPPTRGQRASVVAWTVEGYQSAETWAGMGQEEFELEYS